MYSEINKVETAGNIFKNSVPREKVTQSFLTMAGYYAVRVGRVPGVYRTWDACKGQTHRFPGAVFKRFDNPWSAAKFVAATVKPPTTQRGLASFFKRIDPPK